MNLALGIMFLWLGVACIWVSSRGTDADTPWKAYQQIVGAVSKGAT